jgi:ABC-type multidrug transport system ATPase subunit
LDNLPFAVSVVNVSVQCRSPKKCFLDDISCSFDSNSVAAIMGPSGSGKTTLLNVLSGSVKATRGEILLNGAPSSSGAKGFCAIIPQDDLIFSSFSPRETLQYVARLRLGDHVPFEDKMKAVEKLITRLSLSKCADTPVGNVDVRGVSGGERKRTSIACELLVNPSVLLVDEPTSGLDSHAAHSIVQILRDLAHEEGRTVVVVIHQPSWQTFLLFDSLVMLWDGRIVFDGPSSNFLEHIESLGFSVPPNTNPLDHCLFLLGETPSGEILWKHWKGKKFNIGNLDPETNVRANSFLSLSTTTVSSFEQFHILFIRALQDHVRDKSKLNATVKIQIFTGVALGVLFINQGRGDLTNKSIVTIGSAMFLVIYRTSQHIAFSISLEILSFRSTILREFKNRYYEVSPFFLSYLCSRVIIEVSIAFLAITPILLLAGFAPTFEQYCLYMTVVCQLATFAVGVGIIVGMSAKDMNFAVSLMVPLIMTPLHLVSGFVLPLSELPLFLRILSFFSPYQYGLTTMRQIQWKGVDFRDCDSGNTACFSDGNAYLNRNDLNTNSMAVNMVILCSICVITSAAAFVSTRLKLTSVD